MEEWTCLVMNHRNPSPTTNISHITTDDSYGFYLYFFDEISGHMPLFSYPKELMNDENEKQIISIHSIWWHQDKFLETDKFNTMDLELRGVTYSATLVLCKTRRTKRRSGMDSTKWQAERFVLIVRAPSTVSFIAQEILYELKTRIQGNIGDNLCLLAEYNLKKDEDSEIKEFLSKKSREIEEQLAAICNSLIPKVPISKLRVPIVSGQENIEISSPPSQESKDPTQPMELRFSIPRGGKKKSSKTKKEPVLSPKPRGIKIVGIESIEDDRITRITIQNISPEIIHNAQVKIYESQGFFGKDALVSKIKKWAPKENISLEFEPSKESGIIYFLKIDDEHENFYVKRILG